MGKIGAVAGLAGIVIVAASFAGPWWTASVSISILGEDTDWAAAFGLNGGTVRMSSPLGSRTETVNYSDNPSMGSVFLTGMIAMALAAVFGVLMVALSASSGARPNLRKIVVVTGVLAFAFAALGPLYVMNTLPGAFNQDSCSGGATCYEVSGFFGSESTTLPGVTTSMAWGGGWGWYVALVGAFVLLVGAIVSMRAPKTQSAAVPGYYSPPPAP